MQYGWDEKNIPIESSVTWGTAMLPRIFARFCPAADVHNATENTTIVFKTQMSRLNKRYLLGVCVCERHHSDVRNHAALLHTVPELFIDLPLWTARSPVVEPYPRSTQRFPIPNHQLTILCAGGWQVLITPVGAVP
jgi:hypothetical protein